MKDKIGRQCKNDGLEMRVLSGIALLGLVALLLSLSTGYALGGQNDGGDPLKPVIPPHARETLPEKCRLEPDRGSCKGLFWKYHFDSKSATCKKFVYGGCDGVVPFETREECEQTCLEQKPYGSKHVDVRGYFSCDLPRDWSLVENSGLGLSDEEKKTHGITLVAPRSHESAVWISLYYYAEGNLMYKAVEDYLNAFAKPALGVALEGSSYSKVTSTKVGNRDGMMFERIKQVFVPLHNGLDLPDTPSSEGVVYERRPEMMAKAVPVKERFVVLPARTGFYALRYSAPADEFAEHLSVFEQVTASFHPGR